MAVSNCYGPVSSTLVVHFDGGGADGLAFGGGPVGRAFGSGRSCCGPDDDDGCPSLPLHLRGPGSKPLSESDESTLRLGSCTPYGNCT